MCDLFLDEICYLFICSPRKGIKSGNLNFFHDKIIVEVAYFHSQICLNLLLHESSPQNAEQKLHQKMMTSFFDWLALDQQQPDVNENRKWGRKKMVALMTSAFLVLILTTSTTPGSLTEATASAQSNSENSPTLTSQTQVKILSCN